MYIFIVRSKSEREGSGGAGTNGAEDPGCSTESAEAKASGRAGASDFDIEQTPLLCGHPPLVEWHGQPKRLAACWEALTLLLLGSVMWTRSGQEAALLKAQVALNGSR